MRRSSRAAWRITTADGQRIPIKVEPRSQRFPLVGTAFDYLLRFEIQRRVPHAVSSEWVAQYAQERVERPELARRIWMSVLGKGWSDLDALKRGNWLFCEGIPPTGFRSRNSLPLGLDDCIEVKPGIMMEVPIWEGDSRTRRIMRTATPFETGGRTWIRRGEITRRVGVVLKNARAAVDAYLQNDSPTDSERTTLAGHAIRLAKLDLVGRISELVPDFEEAAPEDIRDLVELLAIAPFDDLVHQGPIFLNPLFGETGARVGGADADLISGDMLIDIKTTRFDNVKKEYLNQLLGYFLLARRQHAIDPLFPVPRRFGIYYSRYGYLYSFDAIAWIDHPRFLKIEQWFLARIERLEGHSSERFKAEEAYLLSHCPVCQSAAKAGRTVSRATHKRHECRCQQCQNTILTFSSLSRDELPTWLRQYWDAREGLTYEARTSDGLSYRACRTCKMAVIN